MDEFVNNMNDFQLKLLQDHHRFLDRELVGQSVDERLEHARMLITFQEKCAEIATRECIREQAGKRCFSCKPLIIMLAKSDGVKVFATFQMDPACAQ